MTESPSNDAAKGPKPAAPTEALYQTLDWVLKSLDNPALASADWVAQEVDPSRPNAVALLTDPATPLSRVVRARSFYMALRADGESAAERTLGGRMALAAAAAALVFHRERITAHDDAALTAALRAAEQDASVPAPIRSVIRRAIQAVAGGHGS